MAYPLVPPGCHLSAGEHLDHLNHLDHLDYLDHLDHSCHPDRLEHVDYLGQFDHLNHQDYQITTTMKLILIQSYSDHLHHQHYLIAETSMHTTFDAATYWPAGHFVTNVIYFSQFNDQ